MNADAMCACGQALALGREAQRGEHPKLCGNCNFERSSVSGRTPVSDDTYRDGGKNGSPFASAPAIGHPIPAVDGENPWGAVTSTTRTCGRCDMHPVVVRDLCGACLGRELLGFASREEQAAAIKELFGRLTPEALAGLVAGYGRE